MICTFAQILLRWLGILLVSEFFRNRCFKSIFPFKFAKDNRNCLINSYRDQKNVPAGNCMFKVDNRDRRARCGIFIVIVIVFIVNFEHILHLFLVFLLLTLSR